MQTIGDIVSRVRGQMKAESDDAFVKSFSKLSI